MVRNGRYVHKICRTDIIWKLQRRVTRHMNWIRTRIKKKERKREKKKRKEKKKNEKENGEKGMIFTPRKRGTKST